MKHLFTFLLILSGSLAFGQKVSTENISMLPPIHQLRIYEIPKENKLVFLDRFRDHALRIMKKYGFTIVAIWESESKDKTEFVYLLEWKDEATMKKSWERFMADKEWKEIKAKTAKQYGNFVNEIEDRTLKLTDFSPEKKLLK
ncbi:heme-degrading monooxygenase HmoA [Chryseobacterium bernardetii]|jgi:heme-degrading monooxygenase HmoA|uniref:NIPSNAP protein n=4 Tax=Chryseobacterium TaxID=59732 RepID=A0A543EI37_9FLAO|nr:MULTISPECIES: NIPSNAP family protein [Chryseobacterium]MDR6371161.1 heme-degrading monooxygenase HmoA [Chryseobacterium vietnamense]MDR6441093.1 heme-degrading monooxygenase HmoA [Chryseobacterium bernardetii]MDR6457670.1 heme-degrading monooxygenase HmoA [Chryseobacterium vietnamense]TQM21231.1 NIPSNAP protein [Chryseobacterium aquifrigidense]